MHNFRFLIHLGHDKTFQSIAYSSMKTCITQCEKKLRELHINHSDGVELVYIDEHGDKWIRKPKHGEINS